VRAKPRGAKYRRVLLALVDEVRRFPGVILNGGEYDAR
jgi:hypothetical protein